MNKDKSDYKQGLLCFICLVICIGLFFTVPDGDTLLYKFLGLFGLSPGIPVGKNSTLYIYMLIPLIGAIASLKKVFKYWQGYGSRFTSYNFFLRHLPTFIVIVVLFISNMVYPSIIDRAYFAIISQRSGLRAVTYYGSDTLEYKYTGNIRTYSCDLLFMNHSNDIVNFNVKLIFDHHEGDQEVFVKDDNGQIKVFTLSPKQITGHYGQFTEYHQTDYDSGGGSGIFSIILLNDREQYSPKRLVRRHFH